MYRLVKSLSRVRLFATAWIVAHQAPLYMLAAAATAAATKLLQLCLTLCDPTDGSPPGSPIPGILQARTLEWVTAGVQPRWIQGIRSGDGVGEDQETIA